MNELARRVLTAAIGGTVFLAAVFWQPWSMAAAFGLIAVFSLYEFYTIFSEQQETTRTGVVVRTLVGLAFYLIPVVYSLRLSAVDNGLFGAEIPEATSLLLVVPLAAGLVLKELWRNKKEPFSNVGIDLAGILYIAVPLALLMMLGLGNHGKGTNPPFNPGLIIGILFLIWANDIGAYFSGRAFGKTPLFKRVSPKKSWEGFAGGFIATMTVAYFYSKVIPDTTDYPGIFCNVGACNELVLWLLMGGIVAIFGPLGDLVESMIKRSKGIKDSGTILPGHGGFLDRFDALFITAPLLYALISAFF